MWGLPVKVMPSLSAICLDFPSIPLISSFIVDSRGEAESCLRRSSRSSIMAKISAGTCCVYSLRLPVAAVCNPMRMGRWSEVMVVCVCHSDEVMREADANDTSGELGSELPGSLVGESVFRTVMLEMLIESAS